MYAWMCTSERVNEITDRDRTRDLLLYTLFYATLLWHTICGTHAHMLTFLFFVDVFVLTINVIFVAWMIVHRVFGVGMCVWTHINSIKPSLKYIKSRKKVPASISFSLSRIFFVSECIRVCVSVVICFFSSSSRWSVETILLVVVLLLLFCDCIGFRVNGFGFLGVYSSCIVIELQFTKDFLCVTLLASLSIV